MHLRTANTLNAVSKATYSDNYCVFPDDWIPNYLDPFEGRSFSGFVASNEYSIILAFRGTQTSLLKDFEKTLRQWLTNINYAQIVKSNYRVHKGFDCELDSVYHFIVKLLLAHGANRLPIFVTGHSAGAALATIAARRLVEQENISVDSAYVYSSPRIGDWNFVNTYPIPLYRFELKDDIVPHVPFSPSLAAIAGKISFVDFIDPLIGSLFPSLSGYASDKSEYIHAGQLFYCSWENELLCGDNSIDIIDFIMSMGLKEIFSDIVESDEHESLIITVPHDWLNITRVITTFQNISEQLSDGKLSFLNDHNLLGFNNIFGKIFIK